MPITQRGCAHLILMSAQFQLQKRQETAGQQARQTLIRELMNIPCSVGLSPGAH